MTLAVGKYPNHFQSRESRPVAIPWESRGSNPSPYNVTSVSPRAVPRLGLSEVTWGVPGQFLRQIEGPTLGNQ